ncbi:MAG TPA: hypothetical protein VMW58_01560 [Anaerolineae bacterium]|nr:hypothetical protein [Anaerolineae bacterium]
MSEVQIVFNLVVVLGFLGSLANYWLIGKGRMNRLLFLFVLSCFVVTESIVAFHQPVYWLYVALNVWGIWNLWRLR